MTSLTPPEKRDDRLFVKWWYFITSNFLSGFFVIFLTLGSIFYHWYQLAVGIETHKVKDNSYGDFKPGKAYKDTKKIKVCKDLAYYARQIDLDLETTNITTKDGFILVLHHLIDPQDTPEIRQSKPPILLQHGLLSSSGCFLTSGYNSLAYYLVKAGYDVWLGNNRSGFKLQHESLTHLATNETFWDWDVRNLAYYDLPCIIDSVLLQKPNHQLLTLVGHSQGCSQSFLLLKNPDLAEYHKKISSFVALAPAVFPGPLFHHRMFLKFMHALGPLVSKLFFGTLDFLPILTTNRKLIGTTALFGKLAYYIFKFLFGWNGSKWGNDHKVWHIHFIFNVSFVSAKLMNWWVSYWREEGFSNALQPKEAYKSGDNFAFTPVNSKETTAQADIEEKLPPKPVPEIDDSQSFFPYKTTWFGQSEQSTIVPMLLFLGNKDFLVDGSRLASHMRHYEKDYLESDNLKIVELDDHSHMDVVWSEDVIPRIGYVIKEHLDKLGVQQSV